MNSVVEIEGKFLSKQYLFVVNTIQAMILMIFNEIGSNKEINLTSIMQKLNLTEEDLKVSILPLVIFFLI